MRKRWQVLILIGLICLSTGWSSASYAQTESALRGMLARVPNTSAIREELLSYLDLDALITARTGAAHPRSIAEWDALDQTSEAAGLYNAVRLGIGAGMPEVIQTFRMYNEMRTATGIDLFTIDRMMTGNKPPSTLNILEGSFVPKSVSTAFAQREYKQTTEGDYTVLCPPDGCDSGLKLNLKKRDVANPFGGKLGRSEPLAVSAQAVLNSPDYAILDSALKVQDKLNDSLAANKDYLSITNAADGIGTVLQAYYIPAPLVSAFDLYLPVSLTAQQQEELRDAFTKSLKPIPQYSLALFAHVARSTDQAVIVALTFDSEEDAKTAAEELPKRLDVYQSVRAQRPFIELITERGGKIESTDVVSDAETGKFVVVMTISAPWETNEKVEDRYVASGILFRLFFSSLAARDTAWLITQVPA